MAVRDIGSLRMMGWGLMLAENSSAAAAAAVAAVTLRVGDLVKTRFLHDWVAEQRWWRDTTGILLVIALRFFLVFTKMLEIHRFADFLGSEFLRMFC